jgi:peptide/nickel transport system permease protein
VGALLRRVGLYVFAAWVAITINFLLPRLMPGNPIQQMIGKLTGRVTPQIVRSIDLQFGVGLHQDLWHQYLHYWNQLFHGDLGESITLSAPVSTVLHNTLPWTLGLIGSATLISFALGTLAGTWLGWRRGSRLDDIVLPTATVFQATPYFFLGIVLLIYFGNHLHWFPVLGAYSTGLKPTWGWTYMYSVFRHWQLPALTVILTSVASWIMGMRNMMVTTIGEEYVVAATARGLPGRKVITYAARNAVLPSISNLSVQLGLVVSGSLLVELVFNYPGVGNLLLQAVQNEDYPLLQGIFLVITLTMMTLNFVADLAYLAVDPRTRVPQ